MSEKGQICRTVAQRAMEMRSPCIQLTPVFPNDLEEWSKFYFYVSEMMRAIEEKTELPILIDIKETGGQKVQCLKNDSGYHEFMNVENESMTKHVICIHCGELSPSTNKTPEQLKKFFEDKKFEEKKIPETNQHYDHF